MPSIRLKEKEIFYIEQGRGRPLIFVHGLGGDHHLFDPQIEYFSQTHRVIAPHNRGNGLSDPLVGSSEDVLDQQCEDLAALCNHLGVKQAVFCGTSYGGVICFHFVLRYPEFVTGLVISDSFSDTRITGIAEALIVMSNKLSIWTSYLPGEWMIPFLTWRYRKWPEARQYALYVARTVRKRDLALQRAAVQGFDCTDQLRYVHCPVLGFVGDTLKVSVQAMRRAINEIPGAKLCVVKDSFDPSNLCQSKTYNSILRKFLVEMGW